MRRFGDFAAAEDAVQEALIAARAVAAEGVPDNPRGWLIHVAARRMTDHIRAELARRRREAFVVMRAPEQQRAGPAPTRPPPWSRTTRSILLFMCCHPGADAGRRRSR